MNDFRKKTGSGNKHNFKTGPEKGKFGKNFVPEQKTEKIRPIRYIWKNSGNRRKNP